MRFLKRESASSVDPDFGMFWGWWTGFRDVIAAAIDNRSLDDRIVKEISAAVDRLCKGMAWELAPGRSAKHAFCLTPEGDAEKRPIALRWLASAPQPDTTWEYYASRQPSSLTTLNIGGHSIDLTEMRAIAGWDAARQRLDVRLWHPVFPSLSDEVRGTVPFLFLDELLGEDDVERWVGQVDMLDKPIGGRTPDELRAELDRRRREADGQSWVLAQRTDRQGSVAIVSVNVALKQIDYQFADHVLRIDVDLGRGRMPDDALAGRLNAAEDDLRTRIGPAAIYAGRSTEPGRRSMFFATAEPDAVRTAADAWARALDGIRARVEVNRDPRWSFQKELIG